jgi:hypothetical protein
MPVAQVRGPVPPAFIRARRKRGPFSPHWHLSDGDWTGGPALFLRTRSAAVMLGKMFRQFIVKSADRLKFETVNRFASVCVKMKDRGTNGSRRTCKPRRIETPSNG